MPEWNLGPTTFNKSQISAPGSFLKIMAPPQGHPVFLCECMFVGGNHGQHHASNGMCFTSQNAKTSSDDLEKGFSHAAGQCHECPNAGSSRSARKLSASIWDKDVTDRDRKHSAPDSLRTTL